MTVADTAFVLDLLEGDAGAVAYLRGLADLGETLWVPAPAVHELHYGARLCRDPAREESRLDELERRASLLPFDAAAARLAGGLEADLERAGKRPGRVDVQIAAIALGRDEPVVTRDRRFPRPEGLRIERY